MEHIYILDLNQLNNESVYKAYFNQMPEERRKKVTAHHMQADRLRSLGAGIVLNNILKQYGLDPGETRLEYGADGKASVAGRPDIHFNLTHSGNFAAGVCGGSPVGIDVEEIRAMEERIARRFFHKGEYRYLEAIEDEQQKQEAFFRLWVLKESFMKVTGLGMRLPLDAFEIQVHEQHIEVAQTVDDRRYYFKEFVLENSRMAVCSADCTAASWEPVWISLSEPAV